MKVTLIKDCKLGSSGDELSFPGAFRLAFPVKGCVAVPSDDEAVAAIEQDIATTSGPTRDRLLVAMGAAGTWPVSRVEPVVVVPEEPVNTDAESSAGVNTTHAQVPAQKKQQSPENDFKQGKRNSGKAG